MFKVKANKCHLTYTSKKTTLDWWKQFRIFSIHGMTQLCSRCFFRDGVLYYLLTITPDHTTTECTLMKIFRFQFMHDERFEQIYWENEHTTRFPTLNSLKFIEKFLHFETEFQNDFDRKRKSQNTHLMLTLGSNSNWWDWNFNRFLLKRSQIQPKCRGKSPFTS